MAVPKKRWVRMPRIDLDCRGDVQTHGVHSPVRIGIHTTECDDSPGTREMQGVVDFWKRQGLGYGCHILIDADGNSCYAAEFFKKTWAIAGHNTGSIHFEMIGFARFLPRVWWLRLAQLNKLAKWIAYLNLTYGIPIERSTLRGVAGHREFPGQTHTDPGTGFPMTYVLRKAREFRAQGWT